MVGCGLGDDAEELAARGFVVTAFDISAAAVAWCKQRFPASRVNHELADLLQPPQSWDSGSFIVEIYTIQSSQLSFKPKPWRVSPVSSRREERCSSIAVGATPKMIEFPPVSTDESRPRPFQIIGT